MNTIASEIELESFAETSTNNRSAVNASWPFLNSVKVMVAVRVGGAVSTVGDLLAMKQGGVLTLDRLVDEPLDIMVDEHVVARGSLVAVGENFGVRITEVAVAHKE